MNLHLTPSSGSKFHRSILDAMPYPVLVLEEGFRIIDTNSAASQMTGIVAEEALRRRPGEVLRCIHAAETSQGCGGTPFCKSCTLHSSIGRAFQGEYPPRQLVRLIVSAVDRMQEAQYFMTVAPLTFENLRLVLMILEDAGDTSYSQQMLPICSNCKQVRGSENDWQSVESYLASHLEIHCTHSLCPECAQKIFPEYAHAFQLPAEEGAAPKEPGERTSPAASPTPPVPPASA